MKMTKTIREFIEEQVTERVESNAKLIELREAADAACNRWNNALEAVRKEFDAKLAELGGTKKELMEMISALEF